MDHFYGRGRLSLENTSGQSVTLYLPIGTVFPPENPADQNIVAYQSREEVQNTVLRGQAGGGIRVAAPVLLAAGAAGLGVLLRR
ncbi:MAG TPA: hypothetical protein VNM48_01920 [Chloroflexota bacterium]|nr:hypothetical protein [Chloroflexota bacterium]